MKTEKDKHAGERTQHTPGPWMAMPLVENDFDPCHVPIEQDIRDADGLVPDVRPLIAKAYYGSEPVMFANAYLIAAAPEQHEELVISESKLDAICRAIRNEPMKGDEGREVRCNNMANDIYEIVRSHRGAIAKAEGRQS